MTTDIDDQVARFAGDAITANAKYQSALAGIADEVERQKQDYKDAHKSLDGFSLSLDHNTASGSANEDMLWGVADAAQNAAEKQYQQDLQTMSAKDATDKYVQTLKEQRQAFIDSAIKAGFNKDEVKKLADEVFQLPAKKAIEVTAETAGAKSALDALKRRYDNATIHIRVRADGISTISSTVGSMVGISRADGGVIEAYAGGGVREQHVAQLARAGAWRVWAEPETGGEAYIPLSPAKRGTSVPVLAETASRMGFDIVPTGARRYADGGIAEPVAPGVGGGLAGLEITGRLEIGGDGLARIIDGRIVRAMPSRQQVASRFGVR